MGKEIRDRINSMLAEKLAEPELSDCFVVEIVHHGKKLEIYLDSDSVFSLSRCKTVSRYLENRLDETGLIGDDYILEVSSAGVGRPLQQERQYRKNVGRQLEVTSRMVGKIVGKLLNVDQKGVDLMPIKGKKNSKEPVRIEWKDIEKSIVQPIIMNRR